MKRILVACGVIALVSLLAVVAIPFLIDANQFRPRLEAELTTALGRPVKLGNLKLSIWSGTIEATDISIAEDPAFGKSAFLSSKSLAIDVEVKPLVLSRRVNVTGIEIDGPQIMLLQSPAGAWNFSSLGNDAELNPQQGQASQTPDLHIKLLKITNGRISLLQAGDARPKVLDKVALEVNDFAPAAAFPFTLRATVQGGGDLELTGKAGPIHATQTSETPFEAKLSLAKLNLVGSGFVRESTGFSGLLSIDGTVASNGKILDARGGISADQLRLAKNGIPAKKTVAFDFAIRHDSDKRSGTINRGDIRIGKAKAALTGTYAVGERTTNLRLKFAAPAMEIDELTAMLPSLAIVLPRGSSLQGGTMVANFTVEGPADSLVTTGILSAKNTRLTGFDLGSRIVTIADLAGIKVGPDTDFENLSANIDVGPKGMRVQEISVVAPTIGDLSGAGTVSPTNALDFKMKAAVKSTNVLNVVTSNVPFFIQGTSAEPRFVPDVKGIAKGAATNIVKGVASGELNKEKLKSMTPEEAVGTASGIINLFKKKKTDPAAGR